MQRFTSSSTSINKAKLPAIYSKVDFTGFKTVIDYGCGKYIGHIEKHVNSQGCKYFPYDPFNLPGSTIDGINADCAVCSNVLNVIDDDNTVINVIIDILSHCKKAFFTVYEGDKTGNGKQTGVDSYQRNEKLKNYLKFFDSINAKTEVKNGVIYACK